MKGEICHRENELLDALGAGFVGDELSSHVVVCVSCSELRTVAGALLDESAVAMAEAHVPSSGTMWWRMQIRKRQDAQSRAQRSLIVGQAATLLIALALVATLFGSEVVIGVREIFATIRLSTPLVIALATWVLLAPVAGWIALRQK